MNDSLLKIILQAVDKASGPLGDVGSSIDGLEKKNHILGSSFDLLRNVAVGALIGISAAAFSMGVAISTIGISTAAQLETAEVGFQTLLGSASKASSIMEKIKIESARTPFELPGLTQSTQLLTSVTKDGDKALKVILDVGEGLAAMGKGQPELDRIIVNLQQIGAVGKASMVDIKQFAFNGIPIFDMLKKQTGLAGDALDDFISDGKVSFDLLIKMFDKANDAGGPFFNAYINQAGTFNQLLSNSKDAIGILSADIVKQTGVFDLAKKGLSLFTQGINSNKNSIIDLVKNGINLLKDGVEKLKPAFKFLSDNPAVVKAGLVGLAGAIAVAVVPTIWSFVVAVGAALLPIVALIGAIGLLWYAYDTNFRGIKDIVDKSIGWIITNIWPKLINAFNFFKNNILPPLLDKVGEFGRYWESTIGPAISVFLTDTWFRLTDAFRDFKDNNLPQIIQKLDEFAKKTYEVADSLGFIKALSGDFSGLMLTLDLLKLSFLDFYNNTLTTIWNFIQTNFGPEIKTLTSIIDNLRAVWDIVVWSFYQALPFFQVIGAVLLWLGSNILVGLQYAFNAVRQPINDLIQAIANFVGPLLTVAIPVITAVWGLLVMFGGFLSLVLAPIFQVLWAVVVNVFNGILSIITGVLNMVGGVLKVFIGLVRGIMTGDFSGVAEGFKQIWNGLGQFLNGFIGIILSPVRGMIDGIENTFKSINLFNIGRQMIEGLVRGIKDGSSAVANAVSNTASNAIKTAKDALGIKSPSRVFMEIGEFTGEGFALGIKSVASQAMDAVSNTANDAVNSAKSVQFNSSTIDPQTITPSLSERSSVTNNNVSNSNEKRIQIDIRFDGPTMFDEQSKTNFVQSIKRQLITELG